jgi:hypothetical protein
MNVSHAAELDLEAGSTDFLQLVIRRLADGGDVEVSEGARHGQISSEKAVRNLPPVQKAV